MSDPADASTVILESNDGFQFIVRKSAATKSPAIRGMLDTRSESIHSFWVTALVLKSILGNFAEARENKIVFHNMR